MTTFRFAACLLALLLLGSAIAQDAADENTTDNGESAAETETNDTVSVSKEEAGDAEDGEQENRPVNASTDVFVPTEEVSVDKSISMPVDI
ncbi:MAG: hypothetical protein AAFN78_07535 [Pseudomonadota bacterium]